MSNRDGKYNHWHWKGGKRYTLEENEKRKVYYPWRNTEDLANIAKAYNTTGAVDEDYEDRASPTPPGRVRIQIMRLLLEYRTG